MTDDESSYTYAIILGFTHAISIIAQNQNTGKNYHSYAAYGMRVYYIRQNVPFQTGRRSFTMAYYYEIGTRIRIVDVGTMYLESIDRFLCFCRGRKKHLRWVTKKFQFLIVNKINQICNDIFFGLWIL